MVGQAAVGGRDWKRSTPGVRRTRVADAAAQPVSEKYEDIVARLARVVERLEGGGLSLEESIAAFEEGIRLARAGARKLEEAERKVEVLLEGDRTAPFTEQKWIGSAFRASERTWRGGRRSSSSTTTARPARCSRWLSSWRAT